MDDLMYKEDTILLKVKRYDKVPSPIKKQIRFKYLSQIDTKLILYIYF